MQKRFMALMLVLLLTAPALAQVTPQKPADDQPIRISTELVQVDVVVVDKDGRVVRGLSQDDFTLYDKGKKQQISFFEFVDAAKDQRAGRQGERAEQPARTAPPQGPSEADIGRIFAFIIDDLTIRFEDLTLLRKMLLNFVDNQMQPTDLVAIVRTVGGKGILQQFTSDKEILRRAVNSLLVTNHPYKVFNNPALNEALSVDDVMAAAGVARETGAVDTTGETVDIDSPQEESNRTLRAFMTLGTAGFVIDGLRQLPGRKSMVLVSGGLPIFSSNAGSIAGDISYFLRQLADRATRAGVAIHTMDIRGLQAQSAVASFEDTPGRSASAGGRSGFGRVPDETLFGYNNPLNTIDAHQGLRMLSSATGGVAVLNKNNLEAGLARIVDASEGYYLLAYTPSDAKFDGDFRKLEVKVKGDYKIYNRQGYFAREDKPAATPATKQEQVLAAIRSPLARRDIDLDAVVLYKAESAKQGAIDIYLVIDPKRLQFREQGGKQQADIDVVGFVFDELGKLRGGFSETINAAFSPEEIRQIGVNGLTYSANTKLPPGDYQIRLAVRDNKTGGIGTISRFLPVPDLSSERLTASSLLLGAVAQKEISATAPAPLSANRRISRKQDLRYAVVIYNAKAKDGKPQVRTQLIISQNGKPIFKEAEEIVTAKDKSSQVIKVGQLGLAGVKPGRYTMTLIITDTLADKKAQTITRSMDFVVVD